MSSIITDPIDVTEFDGDGLKIIGTDGFNALTGTARGDYIEARGAGDFIDAGKGDDLIDAGMGDDLVYAGHGDDSVLGGGGNDIIFTGQGDDIVVSGEGNDVLFGDGGDDYLLGGDGDDSILGGTGKDTINGGVGNDLLFGNNGADVFEFAAEDLDPRFIKRIGDFQVGEDSLVIKGLDLESQEVTFDATTGHLSIDGNAVISLANIDSSADLELESNGEGEFGIM